jgi:hypothetical protein
MVDDEALQARADARLAADPEFRAQVQRALDRDQWALGRLLLSTEREQRRRELALDLQRAAEA